MSVKTLLAVVTVLKDILDKNLYPRANFTNAAAWNWGGNQMDNRFLD